MMPKNPQILMRSVLRKAGGYHPNCEAFQRSVSALPFLRLQQSDGRFRDGPSDHPGMPYRRVIRELRVASQAVVDRRYVDKNDPGRPLLKSLL
jgi:hypothetical protein